MSRPYLNERGDGGLANLEQPQSFPSQAVPNHYAAPNSKALLVQDYEDSDNGRMADPPKGELYPLTAQESAPDSARTEQLLIYDGNSDHPAVMENGGVPRESWDNRMDFLLSIIGFAVDLANIWRFPFMCYKNGGGAFLIPYFVSLLLCAAPLFFMELLLGQYQRQGAITVWKIAPMFQGIGLCVIAVSYIVSFYYNVIIAWAVYYVSQSFTFGSLPWTTCDNLWNTDRCNDGRWTCWSITSNKTILDSYKPPSQDRDTLNKTFRQFLDNCTDLNGFVYNSSEKISPAQEYFENKVLDLVNSKGIENIGWPRWQMVICVFLVFTLHFLVLCKGIKISGKVIWVTALAPYLILTVLLFRGLFLPGAYDGIMYYITPRLDKIGDLSVWGDAASQIFFSVGAGFGVHLAYASYNDFHNNCYRDFLITSAANSFTSIFSGFVVFAYIGYMAHKQDVSLEAVATDGPGLVFIVYPEAIGTLEGAPVWSIIFFLMLLTLGIDSAMGGFESIITAISDLLKEQMSRVRFAREKLVFVVVYGSFFMALLCTTSGGIYVFTLLDVYAAGYSLLFAVLFEAIVVSWVYGLRDFNANAYEMLNFTPSVYFRICWKFISPLYLLAILTSSILSPAKLQYESKLWGFYSYPGWAHFVGALIALSSIVWLPMVIFYTLLKRYKGSWKQRLALGISPSKDHKHIEDGSMPVVRFQARHYLTI